MVQIVNITKQTNLDAFENINKMKQFVFNFAININVVRQALLNYFNDSNLSINTTIRLISLNNANMAMQSSFEIIDNANKTIQNTFNKIMQNTLETIDNINAIIDISSNTIEKFGITQSTSNEINNNIVTIQNMLDFVENDKIQSILDDTNNIISTINNNIVPQQMLNVENEIVMLNKKNDEEIDNNFFLNVIHSLSKNNLIINCCKNFCLIEHENSYYALTHDDFYIYFICIGEKSIEYMKTSLITIKDTFDLNNVNYTILYFKRLFSKREIINNDYNLKLDDEFDHKINVDYLNVLNSPEIEPEVEPEVETEVKILEKYSDLYLDISAKITRLEN